MQEWVQRFNWLVPVLKMMNQFECKFKPVIKYSDDIITIRLDRTVGNRCFLSVYAVGFDHDHLIFSTHIFYSNLVSLSLVIDRPDICAIHLNYRENIDRVHYSKKNANVISFEEFIDQEGTRDRFRLDYPIQEEQLFMGLTKFNLPEIEVFDTFMNASTEILSDMDQYCAFTFQSYGYFSQINETNYENMVQSIVKSMQGLIDIEKENQKNEHL